MFMANYSSVSQSYHAGGHGFHAGAESPGCDVGLAKMCDTSKPQLGGEHASFGVHGQGRQREKSSGGGRQVGRRMAMLPRKGVTTRGARSALLRSECRGPRKVTP